MKLPFRNRWLLGLIAAVVVGGVGVSIRAADADETKPLQFHERGCVVGFVSCSADGKRLAYGLWPYPAERELKGAAVVWDIAAGKEIQRIDGPATNGALSPDGKTLAVRIDSSVRLWDVTSGKELAVCEDSKHGACPSEFTFLPDGRTLAGSFWRDDVYLWDVPSGKLRRRFGAKPGGVEFFAVSGDGKSVVAEHYASRVEDYDPRIHQGQKLKDGKVSIAEVTLRLWDADTGEDRGLIADLGGVGHRS
jgi:WD40 repeat protein